MYGQPFLTHAPTVLKEASSPGLELLGLEHHLAELQLCTAMWLARPCTIHAEPRALCSPLSCSSWLQTSGCKPGVMEMAAAHFTNCTCAVLEKSSSTKTSPVDVGGSLLQGTAQSCWRRLCCEQAVGLLQEQRQLSTSGSAEGPCWRGRCAHTSCLEMGFMGQK